MLATSEADLDGLASINQPVDLVEDDAVVLVALGRVCACSQVDVLPKLLQNDLPAHIHTPLVLRNQVQDQTQACDKLVLDTAVSLLCHRAGVSSGAPLLSVGFGAAAVLCAVRDEQRHRPDKLGLVELTDSCTA